MYHATSHKGKRGQYFLLWVVSRKKSQKYAKNAPTGIRRAQKEVRSRWSTTTRQSTFCFYSFDYRPHTTVKNARNIKSVSHAKLPYFEGIFKLWLVEQQELPFLQMFISFACQKLRDGFRFPWKFWCCMRSISFNHTDCVNIINPKYYINEIYNGP